MNKLSKRGYAILSSILIVSILISSFSFYYISKAYNDSTDYASVKRDTAISVDSNGILQISRTSREKEIIMGKENSWTLFIYLCGSNLESQYQCATNDIQEMLSANINSENIQNVNIIIQTGGSKRWSSDQIAYDKIGRYKIDANTNKLTLLQQIDDANMGTHETLYDFLDWGISNYPSEHMGVILWNHGSGVKNGLCIDEKYSNDSLSVHELEYTFARINQKMTSKFEMIGFDTCLSGSLEYANLLAPYAKYMVASADIEPGDGWSYTEPINFLLNNPDASGAELGKVLCDSYANFYETKYANQSHRINYTLATYDLSKVDKACIETNYLTKYLFDKISTNDDEYWHLCRFRSSRLKYDYDNLDIGSILDYFDTSTRYDYNTYFYRQSLNELIIYSRIAKKYEYKKAIGITLYLPSSVIDLSDLNTYRNICFSPYWLKYIEWINTRTKAQTSNGFKIIPWEKSKYFFEDNFDFMNYDECNSTSNNINSDMNDMLSSNPKYDSDGFPAIWYDNITLNNTTSQHDIHYREILDDMKINTSDTSISSTIPDDNKDKIKNVYNSIFATIDNSLVCLGQNNKVEYDKESGELKSTFNGEWFMLPDGQFLTAYIVAQDNNSTIYSFPVVIDDVESSIRIEEVIQDNGSIDYYTLGIWDSSDSKYNKARTGRSYLPIKPGTTITPIYDVFNLETDKYESEYGDEYTINDEFVFLFTKLNDGEYSFAYELEKVNDLSAYSEIKDFKVNNNSIIY